MADSIGTKEFSEKYGVTQQLVSKWCRENLKCQTTNRL